MRTKHHLLPKCQGGTNDRDNIRWVNHRKHLAWNVLTNMSQMSFEETAEALSIFIPRNLKFVVVQR
jgi:hypothetical protein